jgi:hypothetical protein
LDLDDLRVFSKTLDQAGNPVTHRRGEKQGLPLRRQGGQQLIHFLLESHVEHAVRLVENGHADLRRIKTAAPEVVEQPSRSADNHLGTVAQGAELAVHGRSSVNRSGVQAAHLGTEAVDLLAHLHRQFARRTKDQHLGVCGLQIQHCQRGQGECRGFSRSGGREPNQVLARHGRRNAHRLNRRGPLVAKGFNGCQQGVRQSEFGKRWCVHESFVRK